MRKYDFTLNINEHNVISMMINKIKESSVILELGPAHGRMTKYLKEKKNCVIDIVEIDEESGKEAACFARNSLIGPELGDIDSLRWQEALTDYKYDYIIFADVLEHLYYPEKVLASTHQLLNDEGSLFISIPNIAHNAILINLFNDSFPYTETGLLDNSHIRFWGLNDFNNMIKNAGYLITNIEPVYKNIFHTEQAAFFPESAARLELLFNSRPRGDIYQYFIQLHKQKAGIRQYDFNTLLKRSFPMAVYFDSGDGFSEEKKTFDFVTIGEEFIKEILIDSNVRSIRIDPIEGIYSKVNIEAQIDGIECVPSDTNALTHQGNNYEFFIEDPWLILEGPFKQGQILQIRLIVNDIYIFDAVNRLKQISETLYNRIDELQTDIIKNKQLNETLNRSLNEKNEEVVALNQFLTEKKAKTVSLNKLLSEKTAEVIKLEELLKISTNIRLEENHNARQQLENLSIAFKQISIAYNDILNSTTWKLTKPIRIGVEIVKSFFRFFNYCHQDITKIIKKITTRVETLRNYKKNDLAFASPSINIVQLKISVSVVIPTYNAGEEFEILLRSLLSQEGISFMELIVVDSGSIDKTVDIAQSFGSTVIPITQEEFSHSYARNLGANHTSGEYILFMTQDALPKSAKWLMEMYRPIVADSRIVAVSCGEEPRSDADLFGLACSWGHARFMGVLDRDRILRLPKLQTMETIRHNSNLNDVACLVKKSVFEEFKYRFNYAEDLDLGIRLIKKGYCLALLGTVKVIHSHNRPEYYYLKRAYVERKALHNIFPEEPLTVISEEDFLLGASWLYNQTCNKASFLSNMLDEINIKEYIAKVKDLLYKTKDKEAIGSNIFLYEPTLEFKKFIKNIEIKCNGLERTAPSNLVKNAFITYFHGQAGLILDYLQNHYDKVTKDTNQMMCKALFCVCANATGDILGYTWLTGKEKNHLLNDIYETLEKGV